MAELVKQRLRVGQRDQHRLARRALDEVVVVRRNRRDRTVHRVLRAMARRPRARSLSRSREVVEIEQRAMRAAVRVDDFPHAHVRMKHRNGAGDLPERDAEAALGRPQRRRHHVVELEVRLDLGFVEIVFRLAQLLGEIEAVPRLDRDRASSRSAIACISATSAFTRATTAGHTRQEKCLRRFRIRRHRVGHAPVRVTRRTRAACARSARSLTMAVMVALVSFASPLSPRLLNFLQTISRRSRRGDDVRNGSTLDRVFTIASAACRPSVDVFSSASTFARNSANRARQLLIDFRQPLLLRPHSASRRGARSARTCA